MVAVPVRLGLAPELPEKVTAEVAKLPLAPPLHTPDAHISVQVVVPENDNTPFH